MKRTKKAAALLFAALLPCLGAPAFAEGETQEAVPLTGEYCGRKRRLAGYQYRVHPPYRYRG